MKTAYYEDARTSASDIKAFALGGLPALNKAREQEDTPALLLGRAVHSAVLTPEEFSKEYAPANFDGRTKEGKAEKAEAEAKGLTLLKKEDYEKCLWAQEFVAARLSPANVREREFYTDHTKAKIDGLAEADGVLYELKTCSDVFAALRDFWARAYDLQLGHYANVMKKNGVEVQSAVVIFCAPVQGLVQEIHVHAEDLAEFRARAEVFAEKVVAIREQNAVPAVRENLLTIELSAKDRPSWIADREDMFLL